MEQSLFSLLSNSVLSVEGRVYPLVMPQNCPKPALVYHVVNNRCESNMSGWCEQDDSSTKYRVQVDVYSKHYAEQKAIANEVKTALKSFAFAVKEITSRDLFEADTELYRELIEFKI